MSLQRKFQNGHRIVLFPLTQFFKTLSFFLFEITISRHPSIGYRLVIRHRSGRKIFVVGILFYEFHNVVRDEFYRTVPVSVNNPVFDFYIGRPRCLCRTAVKFIYLRRYLAAFTVESFKLTYQEASRYSKPRSSSSVRIILSLIAF